jgi:hypothetical protein
MKAILWGVAGLVLVPGIRGEVRESQDASLRAFSSRQEPELADTIDKALSAANRYRPLRLRNLMEEKRVLRHETQGSALYVDLQEEGGKARLRFIAGNVDHVLLQNAQGGELAVGLHSNGQIQSVVECRDKVIDGVWMTVHPTGALHLLVRHEKGKPVGNLREWDDQGTLVRDVSPDQIAALEAEKAAAEEQRVSRLSTMAEAALARFPDQADDLKRRVRRLKRQMANLFARKQAGDIDMACEALGDVMRIAGPDAARAALDDAVANASSVAAQAACLAALEHVPGGPQDLPPLCLMLRKEWQALEPAKKERMTQNEFRSGLSAVILGLVQVRKEDLPGMGVPEGGALKDPAGWLRKVLDKAKGLDRNAKAVEQIESALKGLK